jgi:hypothetical protein
MTFNLFRPTTEPDDASPERWRMHIVAPAIAFYAVFAVAVTVFSMAR